MRNKLIFNLINFNYIVYMGFGDGIQILKDLFMNFWFQESWIVFSGLVSILFIIKFCFELGCFMSVSSGLLVRLFVQNGSVLKREFFGGSYSVKWQFMFFLLEGFLFFGGMD